MAKRDSNRLLVLIEALCGDPQSRLVAAGADRYLLSGRGVRSASTLPGRVVRELWARGLLVKAEPERYAAAPETAAWLKRRTATDLPFRMQHDEIAKQRSRGAAGGDLLMNLQESPIGTLAKGTGRGGKPWLAPHAVAAAERLRREFEIAQLQPRVTANWSASVNTGRRTGDALADLTDMAVAARLRFDCAMRAVGSELSGVLVDTCCFLKGLETVERERQWPARSAKLVLRLALESLARHYGLSPAAEGSPSSGRLRHWGSDGYRPEIS
jgi:hypothetical protein